MGLDILIEERNFWVKIKYGWVSEEEKMGTDAFPGRFAFLLSLSTRISSSAWARSHSIILLRLQCPGKDSAEMSAEGWEGDAVFYNTFSDLTEVLFGSSMRTELLIKKTVISSHILMYGSTSPVKTPLWKALQVREANVQNISSFLLKAWQVQL